MPNHIHCPHCEASLSEPASPGDVVLCFCNHVVIRVYADDEALGHIWGYGAEVCHCPRCHHVWGGPPEPAKPVAPQPPPRSFQRPAPQHGSVLPL